MPQEKEELYVARPVRLRRGLVNVEKEVRRHWLFFAAAAAFLVTLIIQANSHRLLDGPPGYLGSLMAQGWAFGPALLVSIGVPALIAPVAKLYGHRPTVRGLLWAAGLAVAALTAWQYIPPLVSRFGSAETRPAMLLDSRWGKGSSYRITFQYQGRAEVMPAEDEDGVNPAKRLTPGAPLKLVGSAGPLGFYVRRIEPAIR